MQVPAPGVAENLRASRDELERRLSGSSAAGDYLYELVQERSPAQHAPHRPSRTLAIWDLAAVAWLAEPRWVESITVPSPALGDDLSWQEVKRGRRMRVATRVLRDEVMTDFFAKIAGAPQ